MEAILDLYAEPYDPRYPLMCFDESPYQLLSEGRQPLPAAPGQPARYDDAYRREGTCHLFMCFEPLQGWRHVKITDRRTTQDCAHCMRDLVDIHFPKAAVGVSADRLDGFGHLIVQSYRKESVGASGTLVADVGPFGRAASATRYA
jgi:hypothetical protein